MSPVPTLGVLASMNAKLDMIQRLHSLVCRVQDLRRSRKLRVEPWIKGTHDHVSLQNLDRHRKPSQIEQLKNPKLQIRSRVSRP